MEGVKSDLSDLISVSKIDFDMIVQLSCSVGFLGVKMCSLSILFYADKLVFRLSKAFKNDQGL